MSKTKNIKTGQIH